MPKVKRSLRIGFVFDDSLDSNDGVSQYVKTLGSWFSRQGHSVRYLVGETALDQWAGGKVYSLSKNQRVIFNGNRLSIPFPARRSAIKRVLRAEKFDVLHVQVPHSPFMAQKVVGLADPQTAIVGTFHILPSGWTSSWGSRLLRIAYLGGLKRFDKFFSVSPPAAEFAKSAYGIESTIVPNAVDLQRFKQPLNNNQVSNKRIVFLGRLVERKGVRHLLQAFAKADLDGSLVIAGDGPLRPQLEKFTRDNKLDSKVKFLGFIEEADKPKILNSALIACFPSLYGESFGIVLIEAMAAGAGVVIGGDNPGYSSVLSNEDQLLFKPTSIDDFAAKLKKLWSDHSLIAELHDWQKEYVKQYDVSLVGNQLLDHYYSIIDNKTDTRHN